MRIREAKAAVLSRLKDPNSAEFGDVEAKPSGAVCGFVNARNAFGGYAGATAFFHAPHNGGTYIVDPNQDWRGRGYDARLFAKYGCTIGAEQEKALAAADALDASDRRIAEIVGN